MRKNIIKIKNNFIFIQSSYPCSRLNESKVHGGDGWVAETNSLLNCRTGNCTEGWNPSSTAPL